MGAASVARPILEGVEKWVTSSEHIMGASQVGKQVIEFLKNEYEPAIGKEAQALINTGLNPELAMKQAKRTVADNAFGVKRAGLIPILKAAEQQGGKVHANEVANVMNVYLHDDKAWWREAAIKAKVGIDKSSNYKAQGAGERAIRKVSAPMFLSRISIPHMAQAPLNSLLVDGWSATAKAFAEVATSPSKARDFAVMSGAMSQEFAHAAQTGGYGPFRSLLDPLRKVFGWERRWGITFSAISGKWAAIDAASDFAANQSKRAEMHLKLLGLDPQAVLNQGGRLSADDIEKAAYRAASEIMGFRSPLETPYKWEENAAFRIASLYKHYGFRQAKLIKDAALRAKAAEGWVGVAKVAATIGTTFFASGEIIKGVEDLISGKEPWAQDEEKNNLMDNEYLDGIAHAGGFGIMYSIFQSAAHNNLTNAIAGPVISSLAQITQDAYNKHGKALTRDIARKFGLPGTFAVNQVLPPNKKKDEGYSEYNNKNSRYTSY